MSALDTVKADDVVIVFHSASTTFGFRASRLSDNVAVFTGKSRHGKVSRMVVCTTAGQFAGRLRSGAGGI